MHLGFTDFSLSYNDKTRKFERKKRSGGYVDKKEEHRSFSFSSNTNAWLSYRVIRKVGNRSDLR